MKQKSHDDRMLWAQFDSLEMGTTPTSSNPRSWWRASTATPIPAAIT